MGRPHVARVLVKHGYANTINEVFRSYLVKGRPGYVPKERIDLNEAITLIKGAGGIPLIAHPVSLNYKSFEEFEILLKGFIDQGVEGLEVCVQFFEGFVIEELMNSLLRPYNEVVAAFKTNGAILFQALAEHDVLATGAFGPKTGRYTFFADTLLERVIR